MFLQDNVTPLPPKSLCVMYIFCWSLLWLNAWVHLLTSAVCEILLSPWV